MEEETRTAAPVQQPDLEILPSENRQGAGQVWTLQHLGCGERGLRVRATHDFFQHTDNILEHHRKGEELSVAWLRYEYGVFPEQGWQEDPLYPGHSCNSTQRYKLCPRLLYDHTAATKQNLLCGERPAVDIIRAGQGKRCDHNL